MDIFNRDCPNSKQIMSLDGLRGIAVLYVLFSHMNIAGYSPFPYIDFTGSGKNGVFLFFALSSFLLTYQLINIENNKLNSHDVWLSFTYRRILRVVPLYYIMVVFYWALTTFTEISPIHLNGDHLWRHLVFSEGLSIFWTIPVELKFYLFIPLISLFVVFVVKKDLLLFTAISLIYVALAEHFLPSADFPLNTTQLYPHFSIFLMGSIAALAQLTLKDSAISHKKWFMILMEFVSLLSFILVFLTIPDIFNRVFAFQVPSSFFHKFYLMMGILWSVFIVAHINGLGYIRTILSLKIIRLLGIISFSVYLWHSFVISLMNHYGYSFPGSVKAPLIVAVTIVISLISYLVIERPLNILRYSPKNATLPKE